MINTSLMEIILIEDNDDDVSLTIRALKKNHLVNPIVRFKDGPEALDYIFRRGAYAEPNHIAVPKVIFLDLKLPSMHGIKVLEHLKNHPDTSTIPVVVLTSSSEDPDMEKCYALGVKSYIMKPIDFNNFSKVISTLGLYWLVTSQTNPCLRQA